MFLLMISISWIAKFIGEFNFPSKSLIERKF